MSRTGASRRRPIRGSRVAAGRQVLLLNNDVVVTTGWLGRMLRALRGGDANVGLVGPHSNFVSGPQQIEVGYENIAELDGFAWDFGKGPERSDGRSEAGLSDSACWSDAR